MMKRKKKLRMLLIIILSIVGILLLINAYIFWAPQFGKWEDKKELVRKAVNSVYKDGKFHNVDSVPVMLPRSYGKMIKASRKNRQGRVPEQVLQNVQPRFSEQTDSAASVIWLGHTSVLIKINEKIILTDPVFARRASPVNFIGPKPFELSTPIVPGNLPFPDIIMISHDHFDHLDHRTIATHYKNVKCFVVPLGIGAHLQHWGVTESQIIEFDWWQQETVVEGLHITATPAQHFSGRRKQDNSTLWCSWVIESETQKVFFSGDSGYSTHFKEIGDKFGAFDMAFMECGAYSPYWPYIHMMPEESAQAAADLNAKLAIPIHWGKYNLAFHHWTEPVARFTQKAQELELTYATPQIGEELIGGAPVKYNEWWADM